MANTSGMAKALALALTFGGVAGATVLQAKLKDKGDSTYHPPAKSTPYKLLVPVLNKVNPKQDIDKIKPFLTAGDAVTFPVDIIPAIRSYLVADIPGLKMATGGTHLDNILEKIDKFPKDVTYATYDYEPDYAPEWKTDYNATLATFQKFATAVRGAGMLSCITPPYYFGYKYSWNWAELAKSCDLMSIQVQNYQKQAQHTFPDQGPFTIGQIAKKLHDTIKPVSPKTLIYLHLDTLVTQDETSIVSDINASAPYVDGYTLWYSGKVDDVSSNRFLDELVKVLQKIRGNG